MQKFNRTSSNSRGVVGVQLLVLCSSNSTGDSTFNRRNKKKLRTFDLSKLIDKAINSLVHFDLFFYPSFLQTPKKRLGLLEVYNTVC